VTFGEYQNNAINTAVYPKKGDNIYYPALGLGGEAGEVLNKIKKVMRDHNGVVSDEMRSSLIAEIGDCLWYCAALCSEVGITMEAVAVKNIEKLKERSRRGNLQGSGDLR